jgi:hypothetical protein
MAATANAIIAFRNILFSIQDFAPSRNPQGDALNVAIVLQHCDEYRHNGRSTRCEAVVNWRGWLGRSHQLLAA